MNFVVEVDWLAAHLGQVADVVIIDCRFSLGEPHLGRQKYAESHIPGAYYLDLNQDLSGPVGIHGGRHPLPDPQVLAAKLATMGIEWGKTLVVAYDDAKFAFASRLWWLLRYYGHDNIAVLNGGYGAWAAAGGPVDSEVPPARSGHFVPQVRSHWIRDIEQVRHLTSPAVLIDARESDRYAGLREPIDPVAGHIPGAVNYPWLEIVDDQGMLLSVEQQQARWASLDPAAPKIVYCGSGVTACVNLLSMAIAGVPNTLLYPGSWSDWCSYF